jgi:phosphonate transport system substrate-binding protein
MTRLPLRIGSFLAPNMFPVYAYLARYLGQRLGCATEIHQGTSYHQALDQFDLCFICGLAYIELATGPAPLLEPIAAPVLRGERFAGRPVYYSDVVVHRDSPFRCLADLRGCSWCYNEPFSQSGYGITLYWLAQMGETHHFFGRVIESGWHESSLRLVAAGEVDASAIDCQVLAVAGRDHPELRAELRTIACLGPSTIQPVTVARHLPSALKRRLQTALLDLANDPETRQHLGHGFIERFVAVDDSSYNDLRALRLACRSAGCVAL